VRKWYDTLDSNAIKPDGIFWWGFYRNAYLEQFLNALLRFVSQGRIEPETIKSTWEKADRIKEYIHQGTYLIILDGLEQMQKSASGDEFGKMIQRECTLSLIDLSIPDSLLMLRSRGVKGSDEDMIKVINRYKGHALSLTSLAGYLNRYYDGDIKQAPDVKFLLSDKDRFKDVNKLLRKYAEKMSDSERIFLQIFSLFRQEVTEDDFAIVFRHKIEDTKFNDVLVKMNKLDFRDMINGLVDWRLISYDETKKAYTTHPLINGYFESTLDEKIKKLGHKHIYQYFGLYALEWPDTLEEMQPLFEQVYHGCAAGLYDEVVYYVYWKKIHRMGNFFIYHKFGAWEINISLVKTFFPKGDLSQIPLVTDKRAQSWLLNEAGLALFSTARPKEAEKSLLLSAEISRELKDWREISMRYQNLADLQFRTVELESGLESAKKALDAAEKAKFDVYIVISKAYLAWILHLSGKGEEASKEFCQADELQIKIGGYRLYAISGVFYADFLISMNRIDEAFELTKRNLVICQIEKFLNDISRCHRCLGAIERLKGTYEDAKVHLQNALEIARKVGMPDLEIEAMLESGRLHLDIGRHEDAIRDAKEVLTICARTGFKLDEPEAEVVLSKAYMALNDLEQAKTVAHSAYEKAIGMNYRWPEGDAAHLLGEIYLKMDVKESAGEWLEKAVACRREILDPKVEESERILEGLK
jgi:tetratricopeptide (TPR) repeat protein